MTREEIIRMAREAGLSITPPRSGQYNGGQVGCDVVSLERFAALVAAHEREACAKVCMKLEIAIDGGGNAYFRPADARQCVAAIRAREVK